MWKSRFVSVMTLASRDVELDDEQQLRGFSWDPRRGRIGSLGSSGCFRSLSVVDRDLVDEPSAKFSIVAKRRLNHGNVGRDRSKIATDRMGVNVILCVAYLLDIIICELN